MISTKTLCQMFFKLVSKGFKLKKLVVEPKTTKPDEELVGRQLNWSRSRLTSLTSQGYEQ